MSLSLLKDQLLPDGYEPNTVLDRYSSEVRESFKNPGRLVLFNMNDFVEGPDFRHWEEYSKPCMMLLHGRTAITNRDYSWLSPAVFGLIERCRVQDRLVIFHCCHDRVFMEQDIAAHVVISSLVYQLLIAKSLILRSQPRFEELRRKFADPSWCASSAKVAFAVLGELLDMFPEVYILLDRIDRIKGDADRFMDPLVNLVEHSRSKIKVFLVASSNNQDLPEGKMTPDLLENIADRLGDEMFSSLILNQK